MHIINYAEKVMMYVVLKLLRIWVVLDSILDLETCYPD